MMTINSNNSVLPEKYNKKRAARVNAATLGAIHTTH